MVDIPTSPMEVIGGIVRGLWSVIESWLLAGEEAVMSFFSMFSAVGKIGLLVAIIGLGLPALKAYRQGHEDRTSQPVSVAGFVGGIVAISDFLPDRVKFPLMIFGGILAVASVINVSSYLSGVSLPSKWYDLNRWVTGAIPLLILLVALIVFFVV